MIRLVAAELRAGWASWIGIVLLAAVLAASSGVGTSMLETGIRVGGEYLRNLSGGMAAVLLFTAPSGLAVVAAVARLAVDLGRPSYARWMLAGVGPAQASAVVVVQLAVAGLVGGLFGFGAAVAIAAPAVHAAFSEGTGEYADIPVVVGPITFAIVVPLTVLVSVLGGLRAARTAGRGSALAALREPEAAAKRMGVLRWIVLVAVTGGCAAGLGSVLNAPDRSAYMAQSVLVPVYLAAPLLAAGPLIYGAVLRGWTALVPARLSSSWYLARHQARYHLSRSTASITPLFAGTALIGGLFTMATTTDAAFVAAGERGVNLGIAQVLFIAGGPVLLAAIGAAVVVFMSNRTQGGEQALLRASGADERTVLVSALLQAVVHVVTALLLAGAVIAGTAVVCALALGRFHAAAPQIDVRAAAVLAGAGLLLTALATTVPALGRLREPVAARLAAV